MNERAKNRLPRWRLAAGCTVFAALVADLSLLAPVYFRNYELERYIAHKLHTSEARIEPANQLREELVARSTALRLPVAPNDIRVERRNGVTTMKTFYKIQVDLGLYTVNLHFRPEGSSR